MNKTTPKAKKASTTAVLGPGLAALPKDLARTLEPVVEELTRVGESIREVRAGPLKPAAEFLDLEAVRLRIAQEQGGQPLPGQAALVEHLRALPPEQTVGYFVLEAADRQAKCYVDAEGRQLLGVLWLSGGRAEEA